MIVQKKSPKLFSRYFQRQKFWVGPIFCPKLGGWPPPRGINPSNCVCSSSLRGDLFYPISCNMLVESYQMNHEKETNPFLSDMQFFQDTGYRIFSKGDLFYPTQFIEFRNNQLIRKRSFRSFTEHWIWIYPIQIEIKQITAQKRKWYNKSSFQAKRRLILPHSIFPLS